MRSRLGALVAMPLVAAACSSNTVDSGTTLVEQPPQAAATTTTTQPESSDPGVTVEDAELVELPGGWEVVDHPVVLAVRGSSSIQPASRVLDGSEDAGWSSGDFAEQWIEFDLGEPKHIETIRLMVDQSPAGFTVHEVRAGAHDNPGRLAETLEGDTRSGDWLEAEVGYQAEFIRVTTKESPSRVSWVEIEIKVSD